MSNTTRFDLSDRMIHFFRDVDAGSPNSPPMTAEYGIDFTYFSVHGSDDEDGEPFYVGRIS